MGQTAQANKQRAHYKLTLQKHTHVHQQVYIGTRFARDKLQNKV